MKKNDNKNNAEIRVVGWTDYDYNFYLPCRKITDEIVDAIVREIVNHEYMFCGDDHQDHSACCPVLNTGERVLFSQRTWGGVMAMAWNKINPKGKYNYEDFHLAMFLKTPNYPPAGVNDSLFITPRVAYQIKEKNTAFELDALLEYYVCANEGELQNAKVGEFIETLEEIYEGCFVPHSSYKIIERYDAPDIEKLIANIRGEIAKVYSSEFGFNDELSDSELAEKLYELCDREKIQKHGAVAFWLMYER